MENEEQSTSSSNKQQNPPLNWRAHFIELITVVLGVVIAFSLSNWNESRKSARDAYEKVEKIISELESNAAIIDSSLEYHKQLLDSLMLHPQNATLVIKPASVESYSWELARNTDLEIILPYDLLKELTEVYSTQEILSAHNTTAGNLIALISVSSTTITELMASSGTRFSENENYTGFWKSGWVPIFQDMVSYEQKLSDSYHELISKLRELVD